MNLDEDSEREHPAYTLADQLRAMFERMGIPPVHAFPGMTALIAEESVLGGMSPEDFDQFLSMARLLFMELYRNKPKEEC